MPDVSNPGISSPTEAVVACEAPAVVAQSTVTETPPQLSKWYLLRRSGAELARYLLDTEVHTFAFSVAANSILSFIPFIVMLYTIANSVFHSQQMVNSIGDFIKYLLPSNQDFVVRNLVLVAPRQGVRILSLLMILVSCTGIFLPLEV